LQIFFYSALALGVVLGALLLTVIFSLLHLAQKGDAYLEHPARAGQTLPSSSDTACREEKIRLSGPDEVSRSEPAPKIMTG
jgi:hypothetical protein